MPITADAISAIILGGGNIFPVRHFSEIPPFRVCLESHLSALLKGKPRRKSAVTTGSLPRSLPAGLPTIISGAEHGQILFHTSDTYLSWRNAPQLDFSEGQP